MMESKKMTQEMVESTLKSWCDSVVEVGRIHQEKGNVREAAERILADAYDYDNGKVLFKPTLALGIHTFRPTKEGALSYFIGGNSNFSGDNGFLLKPYVQVWYRKLDFILHNDLALVQCNIHFLASDDSHLFVNKSFVFRMCDDGKIRIMLHQSSLPYTGPDSK